MHGMCFVTHFEPQATAMRRLCLAKVLQLSSLMLPRYPIEGIMSEEPVVVFEQSCFIGPVQAETPTLDALKGHAAGAVARWSRRTARRWACPPTTTWATARCGVAAQRQGQGRVRDSDRAASLHA